MKGYISPEYTFWCGVCGQWERYHDRTKKLAKVSAREDGWSATKKQGWVCPACSKEKDKSKVGGGVNASE